MNRFSGIVSAENLSAGYRNNIVWQGANFGVERGEFVAIIGPNGAGKTTLFRLILGLQSPLDGTLRVLGSEPARGNPMIGYVPQRHAIDSEMNIEPLEFVRLAFSGKRWGFSLSNSDREAAEHALEAVGSASLAHRSLNTLSGGELQRIFLAEALVSNPELLLLDEPLSNLDLKREKDLVQLIDRVVRARSVTALLIAHNINPLLPFLDKVIFVANGRVATGKPREVLTSESLTELYGSPVEVLHDSKGNIAIVGIEDHHGDL